MLILNIKLLHLRMLKDGFKVPENGVPVDSRLREAEACKSERNRCKMCKT